MVGFKEILGDMLYGDTIKIFNENQQNLPKIQHNWEQAVYRIRVIPPVGG